MVRVIAAAVAAAAAVAMVMVALAARPRNSVGQNVFVNPAGIIDAYSTPSIAVDPRRPDNVVVAYREDRPSLAASLSWSSDGASTFHPTSLPLPPGEDRPFFPDVAFGTNGELYVTYANLVGRGNVPGNLWVATSSDGGRSLSTPTRVATGGTFQPRITTAPDGAVDLVWLQADRLGQAALTGSEVRVEMAQSLDGGQHWSPPIPVSTVDGRLVSAPSVVVARGSIVVTYERFGPAASNLATGGTASAPESYDIVVTRAALGTTQFSQPVVVASDVESTQRFSLFFPQFPSLGAAPDGSLYLAWDKGLGRGQDVLVARSVDLGGHWSAPVRANDNPQGDGTARQLPTLSIAPNGRVDVVMLDQRNDHTGLFAEAYLATSTNDGKSFRNVALSSAAFDTQIGPSFGGGLPPDLGSHLGIASESSSVLAVWADSRLGTETTGRQDIVATRATLPGRGLGGRSWLLVPAAVLVAAAVLILVLGRRRSSSDVTPD